MNQEEANLIASGFSPPLANKMEGISRWLFEHQGVLAEQFGECTSFRVDAGTTVLRVGDVLFDEWLADIQCSVGIWRPESSEFYPSITDETCPASFAEPLRDQLANDGCLRDIPEFSETIIAGVDETRAWALSGVAAMSFEAQGVHVAEAGGDFIFLVINNIRRAPESSRVLDDARVSHLICESVGPILEVFYSVLEEDPSGNAEGQVQALVDGVQMLGEYMGTCKIHAEMVDSPEARHFEEIAQRCEEYLARLHDEMTEDESLEAVAELVNFQLYLNELYEHYLATSGNDSSVDA